MKSTKNAMLPRRTVVKANHPEVTRIDPEPEDFEPVMLKQRSDKEVAEYDEGFECG
jgi:hypothetical protein